MTLYIGELIVSRKRQLELIAEFSKVTGYKTNLHKSMTLEHTNNPVAEKLAISVPFTIVTRKSSNNLE